MTGHAWKGKTFGGNGLHRWLMRLLRVTDVRVAYVFSAVFVVPVCMMVNRHNTAAIYRYMRQRQGFGRWKATRATYMNHCQFGQVVIDRFAMYAGKQFKMDVEGYEHFLTLAGQEPGFVQLSAHVGNYEMAGYTLVADQKPFNALVFAEEKVSVMTNREKMFGKTHVRMIPVKPDMSHVFLIDRALSEGETVSMPADRVNGSDKTVRVCLLGKEADLPMGPFSVATMRGLDVIAVNVMKTAAKRYRIYVTPLAYDRQASRRAQIHQLADAYAAELERVLRKFPTQWYNYFDFWND